MHLAELLPARPLLAMFLAASFALAIAPGPVVVYIVTRTLAHGRRTGLASVVGLALGNLGNALAASIGLAALFAVSAVAFSVVRYAGAAYLIYLGIRALRGPPQQSAQATAVSRNRPARLFLDGLMVALLNPKTAIFYASFLPQFITPGAHALAQSLLLSGMFVAIAAVTDSAYALAAGALAPRLSAVAQGRSLGRYLSGGSLIGLGLLTAFSGARGSRAP
jgi:threonine/homoserine/homoserine lactone efflux protein